MGDVEDTIEGLKLRLNAATDSDLARKLAVDKRTVSAWRARGAVPDRYRAITSGDSHQTIMTPPRGWGEYEEYAFRLALFRFTRVSAGVAQSGSYSDIVSTFGRPHGFWLLLRRCQQDLASVMEDRADHLHLAFALLLHDDITAGEAAIERDRDYLHWRKPVD